MAAKRLDTQTDLFDLLPPPPADETGQDPRPWREQVTLDVLHRHQTEVFDKLALVREATALPWRDLTRATSEEMGFHSAAQVWFPAAEALDLRRAFNTEMKRLWGAIGDVSLYNEL